MKDNVFILTFFLFSCIAVAQGNPTASDTMLPQNTLKQFKTLKDSSDFYYNKGQVGKSLEINIQILNMGLEINDPNYIQQGYRLIAYDYLLLNDTVLAKENFKKAEKYASLLRNDTAIAKNSMDFANLYSSILGQEKKAILYHKKAIELFKKIKDTANILNAHYNAAVSLISLEDYEAAKFHLDECKTYEAAHKGSFEVGLNVNYGYVNLELGAYKKADAYFKQAIKDATKQDLKLDLLDAIDGYSESLYQQGKYKEAYELKEEHDKIYVDMNEIQLGAKMQNVSAKYQLEEYKKSAAEAELRNQLQQEIVGRKSLLNNILSGISLAIIMALISLFFTLRRRKKLVAQLQNKNQEYLEAKRQSEKLAQVKSNFFSTVSHELRTPLYGVIGLTSILLEDNSIKHHEKDLKSLKFSADYLLALINDVLQINKIDSKSIEEEITVFNIEELVNSILDSFEYMRLQNKNDFIISIGTQVPDYIQGNASQLSQILMNLIGNAVKFTENGSVEVKVNFKEQKRDEVVLLFEISDTGIGIASEKHHIIFEEFSQVESLNYDYQGTGLGLPIVKKLLNLSGSTIKLNSALGKGSTFCFELPFKVAKVLEKKKSSIIDAQFLSKKRILVAEDNRINQIVTQKILEQNGMSCVITENGEEVVSKLREAPFDLVLMDLNMPVRDGFTASKEIRKFNKDIPIVALTAVEIEEMRNEIFDSGMNDIIVKPYDINKFLKIILKNLKAKEVDNQQGIVA